MSEATDQLTTTILAVILVLLFFGVLFLVMLAYYNYRRRQTAREKKEMRAVFDQQLMQARLEIQEQTFTYLSEEIHDNVGQLLSLVKIQLSTLEESSVLDLDLVRETKENAAKAFRDLRSLAKGLHTGHIRSQSILLSVEQEAQRVSKAASLEISITTDGEEKKLSEENQLILFRIIQECLQNCFKHAEASFVNIGFTWYSDNLRVRIRDDGKGFDVDRALAGHSGLGLNNILNRARLTGGSADIKSRPGEGTVVTIQVGY